MELQPIRAEVLAVRMIPNVDEALAEQFKLKPGQRSLGMITTTIDDVGYTALDEATKRAEVEVVYARSFYAGAAHASGPLSGEFIGIIAGPNPDEVASGIEAIENTIRYDAYFEALNDEGTHTLYAHVVARTGSYLSKVAGINEGEPLAYLIAPPLEAMYGLDAALKAADVKLAAFYGPPSETNFGGGLLTGTQSACQAAAAAFRDSIIQIARQPLVW
ncbi:MULTISPECIES: ethanolamine utilization microcompartment protein EutL [Aneurinibacillus]|uniref:Ethanolamine utilization microcompartment protein EutL n=2 Tax=Aneurinibacillus thermoaerophilus TaxID=143495 RepID=A0A1G7X6L7_ANETH|nr:MULTISPECIES: ethanolamine utilization microcompartment protein EutL [Aneurinibacillus]MED0674348.1 ethanolamine utilization microcompartment protein EutL [Aneurinibacillus thermoaerophilus]MED0678366.1 ethanolamine utilization microcompartment protein EutL [Aneurinibacillus thermoaerophilus]MED0736109.1 ethanolamine utilization microcompartment protein EutL [Aneurinibacillus thermoaerophilus]MED0756953.1 ethanolamine utilization microcompartment protein EutL [Aneurinibacillus thermoaerophil